MRNRREFKHQRRQLSPTAVSAVPLTIHRIEPESCSNWWEPLQRDLTVARPKSPIFTVRSSWRKISGGQGCQGTLTPDLDVLWPAPPAEHIWATQNPQTVFRSHFRPLWNHHPLYPDPVWTPFGPARKLSFHPILFYFILFHSLLIMRRILLLFKSLWMIDLACR